jgi:hypothetical protein
VIVSDESFIALGILMEHDLFGKPASTFPGDALGRKKTATGVAGR